MSGCQKCLKAYVGISAFISLLVGVATIAVAGYLLGWNSELFVLGAKGWKNKALGCLLGFGIALFLVSIIGIVAACKKSNCCLCIYQISQFVFFLVFFSLFIVTAIGFGIAKSQDFSCDSSKPDIQRVFNPIKSVENFAVASLCQNDAGSQKGCQCKINNQDVLNKIKTSGKAFPNLSATDGQASITTCQSWSNWSPDFNVTQDDNDDDKATNAIKQATSQALGFLEKEFSCSGFCNSYTINLFSDANTLSKDQACFDKLKDVATQLGGKAMAATGIFTLILFLNSIMVCCLCCTKKKEEGDDGNYYQKMKYYDN